MKIRLNGSNMIGGVIFADGSLLEVADEVGVNLLANALAQRADPLANIESPKATMDVPLPPSIDDSIESEAEGTTKKRAR